MLKITCFACICQIFGYANNTISDGPSAIVRPLYNISLCHITIEKWSQIYTRIIRKCLFEEILILGTFPIAIPIVNSISNLDHEGLKLSCWIFLWLFSEPKDIIKSLRPHVWMFLTKIDTPYCTLHDAFECTLCRMWHSLRLNVEVMNKLFFGWSHPLPPQVLRRHQA